jgi:hypothetical protein
VTLSKFHSDESQFWSDLSATLLSGISLLRACELIQIFVCEEKTVMTVLKILGTNVIQLVDERFASIRKEVLIHRSGSTDTGSVAGDSSEISGFCFFTDKAMLNIHSDQS